MTDAKLNTGLENRRRSKALRDIVPAKLPEAAEKSCLVWAARAGRFFTCEYIPQTDKLAAMELMMAARQRAMDAAAQEYAAL